MRDWKTIAKANGLMLSQQELDGLRPLDALEELFRPLVRDLKPGLEPIFRVAAEDDGE